VSKEGAGARMAGLVLVFLFSDHFASWYLQNGRDDGPWWQVRGSLEMCCQMSEGREYGESMA
jgi:hypothetical protein